MHDVIVWGATGQAKVLHEALRNTSFNIVALVDNRKIESPFDDIPLLVGESGLDQWLKNSNDHNIEYCAIAVGGDRGSDRLSLMNIMTRKGMKALTIVHPTAFVASDAFIGEGCQILAQSAVCTHASLGRAVIVNTAASVDHDCTLGDGVHIAPGARLAGEVEVGPRAFVGTGAIVLPGRSIGEGAIVGAGSVVTRDIPANVTCFGNPARIQSNQSK